jgi:3-deoxy-D-manno-octulosonic-acid transferase
MTYLRNFAYLLLILLCSPVLIFRALKSGKYRDGYDQKLMGRLPGRVGSASCFWIHAVSVGEVLVLRPIIERLRRRHPDAHLVLTCTTSTGLDLARRVFPDIVTCYAPLDFSWAVKRALKRIRPDLLILVELELWPNLIELAHAAGTRVVIINGRLSERSFRGYRRIQPLLRSTFRSLDRVLVQSPVYAQRFIALGTPEDRVISTGNVKYDGLEADRANPRTLMLRKELGLAPSDVVFVAGSTMDGEERAATAAYREAAREHRSLRLIIVPRHKERFEQVAAELANHGFELLRRSHTPAQHRQTTDRTPVILVDTLGELAAVWGLADIAFVGGSLFPGRGGQNMMEPSAYGASVLFGPHTQNFKDAVEGLQQCQGARVVATAHQLTQALIEDLDDPEAATARGERARRFVLAQQGAADRTIQELERLFTPHASNSKRPRTPPYTLRVVA